MPWRHKVWEMQTLNTLKNKRPQCWFGWKSVTWQMFMCLPFIVQSYNQFGFGRPSRNIKFILKETVFSNQQPRCIRQVGVSANQRVYWQTQHWFPIVYNLPDSSILTWFDGSLWGALQPWLFPQPSWAASLLGDCAPHLQLQCKHAELVYTHWKSDPRSDFKSNLIIMFTVFITRRIIPLRDQKFYCDFCLSPHSTPPPHTRCFPFISVSLHFTAFSSMAKIDRVILIKAKYCEGF